MNPVCPYCRMEIDAADRERVDCPACQTPHHQDCFTENGGCTVFGCSQAPMDEPKISLTGSELTAPQPAMPARPNPSADAGLATAVPASSPVPESAPGVSSPPPPPSGSARDTTSVPPPPPSGFGVAPPPPHSLGPVTDNYSRLTPAEIYAGVDAHKSRVVYVLFGLFLGFLGAHSFYARYYRRGAAQLAVTVFWWWLFSQGYGTLITWIWAIVEICWITKDADGVQFS